jgi:hypothetical protein
MVSELTLFQGRQGQVMALAKQCFGASSKDEPAKNQNTCKISPPPSRRHSISLYSHDQKFLTGEPQYESQAGPTRAGAPLNWHSLTYSA